MTAPRYICTAVTALNDIALETAVPDDEDGEVSTPLTPLSISVSVAFLDVTPLDDETAFAARDIARRMLLGAPCVRFVPAAGGGRTAGHVVASEDIDDDERNVALQLVKIGLVGVKPPVSTTVNRVVGASDELLAKLVEMEQAQKRRAVGIFAPTHRSIPRRVAPFPPPDHPFRRILVNHLRHTSVKLSVEKVTSCCVFEAVILPSYQCIRVHIAGIAPSPRDPEMFLKSRRALMDAVLHRQVAMNLVEYDDMLDAFFASFQVGPEIECELLASGMAVLDTRFLGYARCPDALEEAFREAQCKKRGVWDDDASLPPCSDAAASPLSLSPYVGTVIAVPNEVTLTVIVDCDAGGPSLSPPLSVPADSRREAPRENDRGAVVSVVLAYLGAPQQPFGSETLEEGRLVKYSARALRARETLRAFALGWRVEVHPIFAEKNGTVTARVFLLLDDAVAPHADEDDEQLEDGRAHASCQRVDLALHQMEHAGLRLRPTHSDVGVVLPLPPDLVEVVLSTAAPTAHAGSVSPALLPTPPSEAGQEVDDSASAPAPIAAQGQGQDEIQLLVSETEAHLCALMQQGRLSIGTPIPCLIERFVPPMDFVVSLFTLGVRIPVRLDGLRMLPASSTSADSSTPLARDAHRFVATLTATCDVTVVLHRVVAESRSGASSDRHKFARQLPAAVMVSMLVADVDIGRALVTNGFALPRGLLRHVPPLPSSLFMQCLTAAREQCCGVWHADNKDALQALLAERDAETGIKPSTGTVQCFQRVVPLAWVDAVTFTYRHDDEATHKALQEIARWLERCKQVRNSGKLRVGDVVAAKHNTGGDYVRAKIVSFPSHATCFVTFLDYGTNATVNISDLQEGPRRGNGASAAAMLLPPLAKTARHAFVEFPCAPPAVTSHLENRMRALVLQKASVLMQPIYIKNDVTRCLLYRDVVGYDGTVVGLTEALQLIMLQESELLLRNATIDCGAAEYEELFDVACHFCTAALGMQFSLPR